ncbi:hypothetical protein LCGC14_1024940 [marine sediment metagenome]|uniref:GTP-binding protein n=1 Tax=marine sediment metagenome TaxID=412755 RepID=A0A0F9R264_9ZZZZ
MSKLTDYTYKIVILGDNEVGITTLKEKYVVDLFPDNHIVNSRKFECKKKLVKQKRFFLKWRVKRFLKRFNKFKLSTSSTGLTIGVDFCIKHINFNEKNFKLQLWVLSNEERFSFLIPNYYHGSSAILFMYDITNLRSLDKIREWIQNINRIIRETTPLFLVGNKIDLEDQREVSKEIIEKVKGNYENLSTVEISLKTGENVEDMFKKLVEMIIDFDLK